MWIAATLDVGKKISRNNLFRVSQVLMDPGGRQNNQFLATSCNENGKALSLICSFVTVVGLMDEQTTWNSFKWWSDLSSHSPSGYWMHMFCVIAASGEANSLIVLSSILSSWISGSGDGSEDMLITGGDSSGTLSVVGSDDDGALSVEHLSSSLLRDLRKFLQVLNQVDKIDPDWPESCTMQST